MTKPVLQGDVAWAGELVVGVVTSRFNHEVTSKLEEGALARLTEAGLKPGNILQVRVPGAFELPLAARWLLEEGCAAVICLGAVIRGDTAHFDYVCQAVERGLTTLQLEIGRPVVFGVLTTENEEQAFDRVGGTHGHKGRDAAEVALEMVNLENMIRSLNPNNSKESPDDQQYR